MMIFSVNGQDHWSEQMEDILYEMEEAGTLCSGAVYYVGTVVTPKPSEFFDLDVMLEHMEQTAEDEYGDVAEGFGELSKELYQELDQLIKTWLDQNITPCFYTATNVEARQIVDEWCDGD